MCGYRPNYDTAEVVPCEHGVPFRIAALAVLEQVGSINPAVVARLSVAVETDRLGRPIAYDLDKQFMLDALVEQGRRTGFVALCDKPGLAGAVQAYLKAFRPDLRMVFCRLFDDDYEYFVEAICDESVFGALVARRLERDRLLGNVGAGDPVSIAGAA